jgi:hypothetical protein
MAECPGRREESNVSCEFVGEINELSLAELHKVMDF